ncbi:Carboxypeptidase regulatory-like domain-containing protein [Armatimonadetes bacterium GBS]|jgi:hypothetical protein|nr:Carboxypeptidase regulatory-like domain-containing protein [Armatimonadetes bacterium GBS]CUU36464.1 Carboxypeptidase regulatory-like domain-containing protein [Armatimonadetes bacterium GXS]
MLTRFNLGVLLFAMMLGAALYAQQDCDACVRVRDARINCPTDASGNITWTFEVTNASDFAATYLFFLTTPPGVSVSPNPIVFNPPLAPGETRPVTVTLSGALPGQQLCFDLVLYNAQLNRCCRVRHCITIPQCCFATPEETVWCDPHTGDFVYQFTIFNQFPAIVQYVVVVSETPGVSVSPQVIYLAPPLGYLQSRTLQVHIHGAAPGQTVRLRIGLLDIFGRFCCSEVRELTMPPCCATIRASAECTPEGALMTVTVTNWFPAPVCSMGLVPTTPGVSVQPALVQFNPPLQFGETRTVQVLLSSLQNCPQQVCFIATLFDCAFRQCCAVRFCVDAPALPVRRTYTTSADFLEGELDNVNLNTPDQLQLNPPDETTLTYPYAWFANWEDGTVSKFDMRTGNEVARYYTGPVSGGCSQAQPSRMSVDADGNLWVINRAVRYVTVVQILNDAFIDRNGDSQEQTSRDLNNNGCIDPNEILPWGQDERVARVYAIRRPNGDIPGINQLGRAVIVDSNGYIWAGLWNEGRVVQIAPDLDPFQYSPAAWTDACSQPPPQLYPMLLESVSTLPDARPYGLALAPNGFLYGASIDYYSIFEICPGNPSVPGDAQLTRVINIQARTGQSFWTYGIAVDQQCRVWTVNHADGSNAGRIAGYDPGTDTLVLSNQTFGGFWRGCTVDPTGCIWTAATSPSGMVAKWCIPNFNDPSTWTVQTQTYATHYGGSGIAATVASPNSALPFSIVVAGGFAAPAGWTQIDPVTMAPINSDTCPHNQLAVYNYTDFTGSLLRLTQQTGTWTVVYDSGCDDTQWGRVGWNAFVPQGTALKVRVRASNVIGSWPQYEEVQNGQIFCQRGRYLQVQVVFSRKGQRDLCNRERCGNDATPILYDLTIESLCECPRSTLWGTLYCDSNRNGSQDATENGLAGWTVVLRDARGNTASVTTDAQGHYEIETLPSGRYEVAAVIPPAWRSVTPATGRYEVEVQEGRAYRLDFGVALRADVNADGIVDDTDLLMVLFVFGGAGQELPEDVNGDGIVDDADLLIVLFAFDSGC